MSLTQPLSVFPKVLIMTVYWSITSVVVISIVLLSTSPKTDAKFVFTNFSNTTGWSDGTAWMLGLLQSALSMIGYVLFQPEHIKSLTRIVLMPSHI